MQGLKITMFVLGLVVLGTQSLRHVYVKWVEPSGSVLDEFREPVERDIDASRDLDELTTLYRAAHEASTANPNGRAEMEDERRLRSAIERAERLRKTTFEVWFFWLCGLLGIALGLLAYQRVNRWLGMVALITGFTEMAWWTSPLRRYRGRMEEFDRLLTLKLVLSLVSVALLIAIWLRWQREDKTPDVEAF